MELPPVLNDGIRVTVAGRTGTGKTTLARYLLERSPQHWFIINPKHTEGYKKLPGVVILHDLKESELRKAIQRSKYVLLNISGADATPDAIDSLIGWVHDNYRGVGICVDELYTAHASSGRAGPGLVGVLTRGRELKQSFLGLTQRPVWVSRFVWSEADCIISMDLTLESDRDVLVEHTGQPEFEDRIMHHRWLAYSVPDDKLELFNPVPLPGG